jgi:hypothetical protein
LSRVKREKSIKTAISMKPNLVSFAQAQADEYHQGIFSAYIASLVIADMKQKGIEVKAVEVKPIPVDSSFIDDVMNIK